MIETNAMRCAYCNGAELVSQFSCHDTRSQAWSWALCRDCGASSLTPHPTTEQLATAYDASYYGIRDTKFNGPVERFIEFCRRGRARRLARELRPGDGVLDVGCGNGGFLAALGAIGSYSLNGIELEGGSARRAARLPGIRLKIGVLEQGDFEDASLDLVTLFHVFEHLTEPQSTLKIIHRALKPSGRLVMSFPNISSLQARLFKGHWLHLDPPRHLFLFPTDAFEHAMREAGFVVTERRFFSIEQNPFGFIQSALNSLGLPRDLLYERLKGNTRYAPEYRWLSILLQKVIAGLLLPFAIGLDVIESALGRGATVEYTLRKISLSP
ncbi:MAG: class I SAM-dependent methyltransferase [Opitutaceae bacterium]|nr:class I SAM-dependent methyltransferase [Opitutaceae bacterium]